MDAPVFGKFAQVHNARVPRPFLFAKGWPRQTTPHVKERYAFSREHAWCNAVPDYIWTYVAIPTKMAQWTGYQRLLLQGVERTKIKEALGKGSYGRVIEVSVNGTICAAKVIHEILVEEVGRKDFEATERLFLKECANSSQMLHPNVVQFLGIYYPSPTDKLPWLIMEIMYTNLTSLIEKYETTDLPLHIKLSILVDTSQGLQYLHSQDIIHRDLSSNNILLTQHMTAKVADFGKAKMILQDFSRHTEVPGTQSFMAPETLCFPAVYGKPLDVFSLGCVSAHVTSMQWPGPASQIQIDISTGKKLIRSEVERRELYLAKMTDGSPLKLLTVSCLQDEPENRPNIEQVTIELHSIKEATVEHVKHANNNIIDLLACLSEQEKLVTEKEQQITELQSKHQQTLWQTENEITQLREQLQAKCQENAKEQQEVSRLKDILKMKGDLIQSVINKKQEIEACSKAHKELIRKQESVLEQQQKKIGQFHVQLRKRAEAEECLQEVAKQLNAQYTIIEDLLRKNADTGDLPLSTDNSHSPLLRTIDNVPQNTSTSLNGEDSFSPERNCLLNTSSTSNSVVESTIVNFLAHSVSSQSEVSSSTMVNQKVIPIISSTINDEEMISTIVASDTTVIADPIMTTTNTVTVLNSETASSVSKPLHGKLDLEALRQSLQKRSMEKEAITVDSGSADYLHTSKISPYANIPDCAVSAYEHGGTAMIDNPANKRPVATPRSYKGYDPQLKTFELWQCAICKAVNRRANTTCVICKVNCGSSAVEDSYCKSCDLLIFHLERKTDFTVKCTKCKEDLYSVV